MNEFENKLSLNNLTCKNFFMLYAEKQTQDSLNKLS